MRFLTLPVTLARWSCWSDVPQRKMQSCGPAVPVSGALSSQAKLTELLNEHRTTGAGLATGIWPQRFLCNEHPRTVFRGASHIGHDISGMAYLGRDICDSSKVVTCSRRQSCRVQVFELRMTIGE